MAERADVEVVRRFVDACWHRPDPATARSIAANDLAERTLAHAARVRAAGPDVRVELELVAWNDDGWVVTLQRRTHTHTGASTGPLIDELTDDGSIPPTNKRVVGRSAVFYRVEGGRIVEIVSVADNLAYFSQFGRLRLERG